MQFKDFDFHPKLLRGIDSMGFREPSPIQKEAIPYILEGYDLIGQAHTGTGKTAAFALPILDKIAKGEIDKALIIVPTRELATQVSDEVFYLGKYIPIKSVAIYGGVGYKRQLDFIKRGAKVVVATPGRLKDLYKKGKLDNFNPEVVVLDEADEMLDMGFLDDIRDIFEYIPQNRQTLLFSATMPKPILDLSKQILYNPKSVSVIKKGENTKNSDIEQFYYVIDEEQRDEAIVELLEIEDYNKALIFCRTKKETDRLSDHLKALGFRVEGLHGDIEQRSREKIIKAFKKREIDILVATDVAARGLDIKDVNLVFNYHIPFDPQSYVHRIGRTGRAGKKGKAITLVSPLEFKELNKIKKEVGAKLELKSLKVEPKRLDQESIGELKYKLSLVENIEDIDEVFNKLSDDELKRAVSYFIKKEKIASINSIGYDADEVKKLISIYQNSNKRTSRTRRRGR
ncbi:MAG: DEAD/DEAH box helicase [Epsilonproteobacteria bacterium]|nr:DEAD/DEAH box helicase [Campylobacterota bacterium]